MTARGAAAISAVILATACTAAGVGAGNRPHDVPGTPARPNILYVFADDQSHRSIGAYRHPGWPWVRTPSIDRLANAGVRFDSAYCGSWCVPSRVTMLTGLQPHGVHGFSPAQRQLDPATVRFWPEAFRCGGYRTALIGKWHIKGYAEHNLWARDWDHWVAWDHTQEGNGGYYAEKSRDGTQRLTIDGRTVFEQDYPTDNYTEHALRFIRREHDSPWFLWLCYGASHAPYVPAERHRDAYRDASVPVPAGVFGPRKGRARAMENFSMFSKPESTGGAPLYVTDYGTATLDEWVRRQNRTVLAIDEGVGRILAALAETNQLDNTVVVYASDNGFPWGEHGFANKNGPYDACQRTPLIVSWPTRFARGKTCSSPVAQADLVPTFFALARLPLPWEMHGHDLTPLLENPRLGRPHPVMIEYFNERFGDATMQLHAQATEGPRAWEPPAWWISLRSGRHHYIRWLVEGERDELYDLDKDPGEFSNLAMDSRSAPILAELRLALENELRRTRSNLAGRLPKPGNHQP